MDQGYTLLMPFPLSKEKEMENMNTYSVTGTDLQSVAGALPPRGKRDFPGLWQVGGHQGSTPSLSDLVSLLGKSQVCV